MHEYALYDGNKMKEMGNNLHENVQTHHQPFSFTSSTPVSPHVSRIPVAGRSSD